MSTEMQNQIEEYHAHIQKLDRKLIMDIAIIGSNVLLKGITHDDSPVLNICVQTQNKIEALMRKGTSHRHAVTILLDEGWAKNIHTTYEASKQRK